MRAATDACGWSRRVLLRAAGTAKSGASHWRTGTPVERGVGPHARRRRPAAPALARSLAARASKRHLRLLSVATAQRLSGAVEGLLHPALLATLVYRFGRPGGCTRSAGRRPGQWPVLPDPPRPAVAARWILGRARLAMRGRHACPARRPLRATPWAFTKPTAWSTSRMYADWRDAWHNWPRSLAARDALFGVAGWLALLEVLLVQAMPLPLLLIGWPVGAPRRLNLLLLAVRAWNAGRDGARLSVQTVDLLVVTSARSASRAAPCGAARCVGTTRGAAAPTHARKD